MRHFISTAVGVCALVSLSEPGARAALTDLQAQVRAAQLKARDIGATRLILAIAGTHANRRALASARPSLVPAFDLDSRRLLADLAAGRDPGNDGVIVL